MILKEVLAKPVSKDITTKEQPTLVVKDGLDVPVELYAYPKRAGRIQRYRVSYGQDIRENLNYADAASQLGFSIMHSLECAGKLDTSDNGEG